MTKVLHFVKLRTLCEHDDELLLLELPRNPLKVTVPIDPAKPGFTADYLATFRQPIAVEDSTTFLQDKTTSGWLAWDKQLHGYRQAGWEEQPFDWDPSSAEAVTVMAKFVRDPEWWKKLVNRYAQEDTRKVGPQQPLILLSNRP
jgi:proteasome activator subunit 4